MYMEVWDKSSQSQRDLTGAVNILRSTQTASNKALHRQPRRRRRPFAMVPRILFSLLLTAGLQAAQAVDIYLYPARQYAVGVDSLETASGAVSRHLGLERFERLSDASSAFTVAEDFVGTGVNDGILLTMNEVEANGTS